MPFGVTNIFKVPVQGPLASALTTTGSNNQNLPDERSAGLWTWTSTKRLYLQQAPIQMALNSSSVRVTQQKRMQKIDTMESSVFMHFLNRRGKNNDLVKLEFRGNTGNIDLRGSVATEDELDAAAGFLGPRGTSADQQLSNSIDTGAFLKLVTFHQLKQLSQEEMVFTVQSTGGEDETQVINAQSDNEFFLQYISPVYPSNILITGIFAMPVQFEENGEAPTDVDYSFDFWVTNVYPDEDEFLALLQVNSAQALLAAAQQV